ncbi:MAG TPA: sulfatase-like hydrolase/transferase [Polyangia bacterium]|jgi:arylsulfatase A-like enzyme|nr:sulfatase-like hydrolase/transferase [Polyangia bacterium]
MKPFDRSRPLTSTLAITLGAACLTALIDVTLATARSAEPTPAGAYLGALGAALGLYGVAALVFGLGLGWVLRGIAHTLPGHPLERWRRFRAGLREDPERDRDLAAGYLGAGAGAVLLAALVFFYLRLIGLEMASRRNTALSTALVAAAALPLVGLAWFPIYRALRLPARLLPRPRALAALGAMALVATLGVLGALLSVDWRVLNFGPALAGAIFSLIALGAAAAHLRASDTSGGGPDRRLPAALLHGLVLSELVIFGCTALYTWSSLGHDPRAAVLVGEETSGARPLLTIARHLADRDHDGFAGRLGGGDCDDHNPAVHPGAEDTPGDHIDQDCSGSDEQPIADTGPAPTAPPAAGKNPAAAPAAAPGTRSAAAERLGFKGNLLIITIDTLRADRLNPRTMPHLHEWAKDAAVFTQAYAQAPNTPRSFPSFLTSRFPSQIQWEREFSNFAALAPGNLTFFQVLHDAGLHNVGVFSHFYTKPGVGIDAGFDAWDNADALTLHDSNTDIAAPRITPRVIARLEELAASGKRFALWTHYFEPHSRYMEHPEFPIHQSGLRALEEKYDGEVSFVDLYLDRLFQALKKTGLDKNTAVVVFSDHGEAFGEHRFGGELLYFHGQTLYDELLRVPLVIKVPGTPGRRIDDRVMLIDLGPTVVELGGAQVPPSFRGRSLLGAVLGEPLTPEPVFAELLPAPSWNHAWRAYIEGDRKLLYKISENSLEMYDLKSDMREQTNLSQREPAAAQTFKEALLRYMARVKSAKTAPPPP